MEGYSEETRLDKIHVYHQFELHQCKCMHIYKCIELSYPQPPPQARLAQQYGCKALLLYTDPAEYAPRGGPLAFPDGTSLPPSGVQRGSLLVIDGDPLTPGIPAIPGVYRRSYEEVVEEGGAPSIPVQPLSYEDAIHFMR